MFGFLTKVHQIDSEDITKNCKRLLKKYEVGLEESLIIECKHLAAYLKTQKTDKISTADLYKLLYKNDLLDIYSNINISLTIYLSLMVSNCSGERYLSAFLSLSQNNYLRCTQEQDRLNNLSILFIERDSALELDYDTVIDEFAAIKARKVCLEKFNATQNNTENVDDLIERTT